MLQTTVINKKMLSESCKRIINRKDTYDWKEKVYGNDDRISHDEEIEELAYYIAEVLNKFEKMSEFTDETIKASADYKFNNNAFVKQIEDFNFKELKVSKKIKLEGKKKLKSSFFNDSMRICVEKKEISLDEIDDNNLKIEDILTTNLTIEKGDAGLAKLALFMNRLPIRKETKITVKNMERVQEILKKADEEVKINREVIKQIYEPVLPLKKALLNHIEDRYEDYDGKYKEVLAPYLKKAVKLYENDVEKLG